MLTAEERIRAMECNFRTYDWKLFPVYKIEKEDAEALMELFNKAKQTTDMKGEKEHGTIKDS